MCCSESDVKSSHGKNWYIADEADNKLPETHIMTVQLKYQNVVLGCADRNIVLPSGKMAISSGDFICEVINNNNYN